MSHGHIKVATLGVHQKAKTVHQALVPSTVEEKSAVSTKASKVHIKHIESDMPGSGCEAREILTKVGDKWSVLVVVLLGHGPMRFNELKRAIEGISQRMLTLTLKGLERDGLVTRTVTPTVPPRVDYDLTELGHTLMKPVRQLAEWADKNKIAIHAARERFDSRKRSLDEAKDKTA